MLKRFFILAALFAGLISGCSGKDPGPLAGVWQTNIGTTVKFRPGETEAEGVVTKVSYKVSGNSVKVVHTAGPTKGSAALYTIIDADNAKTEYLTIKRVK